MTTTLRLCGVPIALDQRIKRYATERNLSPMDAAITLLAVALDHVEARQKGADAVNRGMTPEARRLRAQKAVAAREAKRVRA